jgi:putative nucleotidyltransferase with HDIG domain
LKGVVDMGSSDRRITAVRAYVGCIALLGATAFALSVLLDPLARANDGASVFGVVAFVFIALALQLAEHRLAVGTATGTIAFIVYMASALVFGPTWCAVITAVTVTAAQALSRKAPIKIVFNVSQHVLALVVGTAVYMMMDGPVPPTSLESAMIPFFGFVLASFAINGTAVSGVIAISEGRRFSEVWMRNTWALAAYDMIASALGLGVAWLYVRFSFGGIAAVVVPILFLRHTYLINLQLQKTNRELLDLMVKAIEARDPYTSGHSQRVSELARTLASEAGIGFKEVESIATAALLHDVGKIYEEFAPLLRKEGKLTEHERFVMETHPARSAELVGTITNLRGTVERIVRHHHENFDGSGYPLGLAGEDIPFGARVVMIADTTDAMTTDRPYRNALSYEQVIAELDRFAGKQFDPGLVEIFRRSPSIRAVVARRSTAIPPSMRASKRRLGMRMAT